MSSAKKTHEKQVKRKPKHVKAHAAVVPQSALNAQEVRNLGRRLDFLETMSPAVLVNKDVKDHKVKTPDFNHPVVKAILGSDPYPRFRYQKNQPYKMLIAEYDNTAVGSSATAFNVVKTLTPFNSTDAKAAATLFDEGRCVGMKVAYVYGTLNSTNQPSSALAACVGGEAFDPSNATSYGGVEGIIDAQYVVGPWNWAPVQTTGGPIPVGKALHLAVKIPPTVSAGSSFVIGSNWTNANDTSAIVGYLKPYIESAGAGTKIYLYRFITYEMEFAFRT